MTFPVWRRLGREVRRVLIAILVGAVVIAAGIGLVILVVQWWMG